MQLHVSLVSSRAYYMRLAIAGCYTLATNVCMQKHATQKVFTPKLLMDFIEIM